MPANMENSAVATGLEKVSFHSYLKERQCQRMLKLPHNCTHLTLMLGKIEGRRRRGRQRMRWLDGITDLMDTEFEWTLGVGDGQGGLACCDSWARKESDTTELLNWTELKQLLVTVLLLSHSKYDNKPCSTIIIFWNHSSQKSEENTCHCILDT